MKIIRGKIPSSKKVVIYGPEGIGKSTFASMFPDPVFIDTEGSTKDMDVARTEAPSSWAMLLDQVRYFIGHPEELKTLVIDTADWAEQLCSSEICARYQKSGIEDFGYGKGYVFLQEEFGRLLNLLTELVEKKGIHVVLTAHAKMRKFEQPDEMGAYDRWEMKLTKQVAPMMKEWADMVLFANYKTFVVNVDGQGAQKGKNKVQGGKRVMYTTHHSCWDAKNRYGLPDEVPFNYDSIRHILEDAANQTAAPAPQEGQAVGGKEKPAKQGKQPKKPSEMATADKLSRTAADKPQGNKAPSPPASSNKGRAEPEKETQKPPATVPGEGDVNSTPDSGPDPRIPKKLRDLMISNQVCEWDIQNVVEARGYFPGDMAVADYPEDFIEGCLVAAWDKVYSMICEMKQNDSLVFN